jgi:phosphate/sulfate permease
VLGQWASGPVGQWQCWGQGASLVLGQWATGPLAVLGQGASLVLGQWASGPVAVLGQAASLALGQLCGMPCVTCLCVVCGVAGWEQHVRGTELSIWREVIKPS